MVLSLTAFINEQIGTKSKQILCRATVLTFQNKLNILTLNGTFPVSDVISLGRNQIT